MLHNLNYKKAEILQEQVIFIILNIVFFGILLGFIYFQTDYNVDVSKKIALIIDQARPNTNIEIDLTDFFEKVEKQGINKKDSIIIDNENNLVKINLDKVYDYHFFNDIDVSYNIDITNNKLILKT